MLKGFRLVFCFMFFAVLDVHSMACEHSLFGNGVNVCVNRIIEQLAVAKQTIRDSFSSSFVAKNQPHSYTDKYFDVACKKWEADIAQYYGAESNNFVNVCKDIYHNESQFKQVIVMFLSAVTERLEKHKRNLQEMYTVLSN